MKQSDNDKRIIFLIIRTAIVCVLLLSVVGMSVYAWLAADKRLLAYAPVSSPEALYIGAGHRDILNNTFEDIRYMYFDGLDAEDEDYVDKVFCVYGKGISNYRIQLAYTTNNPFVYELYHATESDTYSEGAIEYKTHQETPATYYYSISGEAMSGAYLNKAELESIANSNKHLETYGSYLNVQKNAEPIYWQTPASPAEVGDNKDDFVNYYILRVCKGSITQNTKETDILCIAARSVTVH